MNRNKFTGGIFVFLGACSFGLLVTIVLQARQHGEAGTLSEHFISFICNFAPYLLYGYSTLLLFGFAVIRALHDIHFV